MDKFDSNLIPLLKGEIENDYEELQKNKKQILNLIKDLNKDIDKIDLKKKKKESINTIKEKFEELEKSMKKFSLGISSFQSYKNKDPKKNISNKLNKKKYQNEEEEDINFNKDENIFTSLLEISTLISHQSQNLYKKFENKIKQAENKLDEIEISSSFDKKKFKNLQIKDKSVNKEKLKMEQKEYQLLLEKSKNILTISNNIKKLTQSGGNLINNIGSNIDSIEDNIINANEELEQYNKKKLSNKKYYWIGGGLIIIIIIIIILIYVKYYYSPTQKKIINNNNKP